MDAFRQLRQRAADKRDKTIREARETYSRTLREIASVAQALGDSEAAKLAVSDRSIRRANGKPYRLLTVIQAAERVLSDGKPLRLTELVLEIQKRGCRAGDDPRKIAKAIDSAFYYHRNRFKRDKAGRWALSAATPSR